MANALQRVLVGVIAIPAVLGAAWIGGWAWAGLVALAAVVAQWELYALASRAGAKPIVALGLPLGAVAALKAMLPWTAPVIAAGVIAVVIVTLYRKSETPLLDAAATLFGVAYPALLLGYAVDLRLADNPLIDPPAGFRLMATVLMGVWGADTLAYAVGRLAGRTPLMPRVSPKKTWEGSAGGLLGAVAVAAACKLWLVPALSWVDVAAIGVICGGISQLGDLAESLFKRSVHVKDSGSWIPGHGGMLDRLDAATVAVPLAFLYLCYVARLV